MEHTWPLRYSVVFQARLWKNRGARGQSITALARGYKASSLCGPPPTVHTHSSGGRIGSRGSATGGSSRSPIEASELPFSALASGLAYLATLGGGGGGGGVTDVTGARQRGRRPEQEEGGYFQINRASNNMQQKGLTVLPVARCRLHVGTDFFFFGGGGGGITHRLLWHRLLLLTFSFVGAAFLAHCRLSTCSHR